MNWKSRCAYVLAVILFIQVLSATPALAAESPYDGYIYSYWDAPIPSQVAFKPGKIVNGHSLGISSFNQPHDLFVSGDRLIYVLDSGNSRIVVLDENYRFINQITGFNNGGVADSFNMPRGIYVSDENEIYVADTGNKRIVHLSEDGDLVQIIDSPKSDVLKEDFSFSPTKVAVDKAKRIYVVSLGVFDGIMEFASDGTFSSFVGANRVTVNPIDYLWKSLATQEQRDRMELFIPTEYTNLDLDSNGFIYATNADPKTETPIKRLNPTGIDVLRRQGYESPKGDLRYHFNTGPSIFHDIHIDNNGIYSALDINQGKIFSYDWDGNLLYIFGVKGNQAGTFQTPTAIDKIGTTYLVLDRDLNRFTVFEETKFGSLVNQAVSLHFQGDDVGSAKLWEEVLRYDVNYDVAYFGISKALLRQGKNKEAAEYAELAKDRVYYSKAYQRYRKEVLRDQMGSILTVAVLLAAALFIWSNIRKRSHKKGGSGTMSRKELLKYPLYVIFHPFNGFWEVKYDRKGNLKIALSILFLVFLAVIFQKQYAGFVVNYTNLLELNSLLELRLVVIPYLLWCVANWSLTTLMDGEGKFSEICIATAYALLPIALITIPNTIISNFIIQDEGVFFYFFNSVAYCWFFYLLFVGIMTVHQYTPAKTIGTILLTIVGMGFIVFLGMLAFSLIQQIYSFVYTIYREIIFRF